MNIAIPMFGTRVSPRFDGAPSVLLVRVNQGSIEERVEETIGEVRGWQRLGLLFGREVDVLLCGGIRQSDYFSIVNQGIEVYPGLIGEVEDVLQAFLGGRLSKDGFCGGLIAVGPIRQRRRGEGCCSRHKPQRRRARSTGGLGMRGTRKRAGSGD